MSEANDDLRILPVRPGAALAAVSLIAGILSILTARECHLNLEAHGLHAPFSPSLLYGCVIWAGGFCSPYCCGILQHDGRAYSSLQRGRSLGTLALRAHSPPHICLSCNTPSTLPPHIGLLGAVITLHMEWRTPSILALRSSYTASSMACVHFFTLACRHSTH